MTGADIMLAALNEAGVNAWTDADGRLVGRVVDMGTTDPHVVWRAFNLSAQAIGDRPLGFDEWCAVYRRKRVRDYLARNAWLDHWGCP